MATVGERLKQLREKRGWSQRDLAREAAVPFMTVYRLETEAHRSPRMDIAKKLARALGVSLDLLCGMYDEDDDPAPARLAAVG